MGNKDYINEEIVRCFPSPVIIKKSDNYHYTFSNGDFAHFRNGSKIPTKTIYYNYSCDLLILDYNREEPIAHIIIQNIVVNTIPVSDLNNSILNKITQVIDIDGNTLKVSTLDDIHSLITAQKIKKNDIEKNYQSSKEKLAETIELSNRMRAIDDTMGTAKILDFIELDMLQKVKMSIAHIFISKSQTFEEFKEEVLAKNDLRIYLAISNIVDRETYVKFKIAQADHNYLKNEAMTLSKASYDNFNNTWIKEDNYILEKQLGCYLECLNEMYWNKDYNSKDRAKLKLIIRDFLNENDMLQENYLNWIHDTDEDEDDIKSLLNEILEYKNSDTSLFI